MGILVVVLLAQRKLSWWDSAVSGDPQHIAFDDVARIKVQKGSESSDRMFFYDKTNHLIRFPEERGVPYDAERWARDLAVLYPHIVVEVQE